MFKNVDEVVRRVSESLPKGTRSLKEDFDKNLHAALRAALAKLDLVTRDEFEAQREVLAHTRAKLDALEAVVREMEAEHKER